MQTTSQYPACADHTEHDNDCTPCYFRREHAENQTRPSASGHVSHPIKRCPDCIVVETAPANSLSDSELGQQTAISLSNMIFDRHDGIFFKIKEVVSTRQTVEVTFADGRRAVIGIAIFGH